MTSMPAPGPWTFVSNSWQHTTIYDANGETVCRLDLEDWGVNEENQAALERRQAKVALRIVAGDCALETLKAMREVYSDTPISAWLHAINAAIAKAEGQ